MIGSCSAQVDCRPRIAVEYIDVCCLRRIRWFQAYTYRKHRNAVIGVNWWAQCAAGGLASESKLTPCEYFRLLPDGRLVVPEGYELATLGKFRPSFYIPTRYLKSPGFRCVSRNGTRTLNIFRSERLSERRSWSSRPEAEYNTIFSLQPSCEMANRRQPTRVSVTLQGRIVIYKGLKLQPHAFRKSKLAFRKESVNFLLLPWVVKKRLQHAPCIELPLLAIGQFNAHSTFRALLASFLWKTLISAGG